jgi:hypothetical protein
MPLFQPPGLRHRSTSGACRGSPGSSVIEPPNSVLGIAASGSHPRNGCPKCGYCVVLRRSFRGVEPASQLTRIRATGRDATGHAAPPTAGTKVITYGPPLHHRTDGCSEAEHRSAVRQHPYNLQRESDNLLIRPLIASSHGNRDFRSRTESTNFEARIHGYSRRL